MISREKSQARDPGGNQSGRKKKIRARAHVPLEHEADPEYERKINDKNGAIRTAQGESVAC
jgi:hypothetical protein